MAKKALADLSVADVSGKRVLVRADFNVPLDDAGNITDDTRIRAALPTIQDLTAKGAKVILASHFGRPKGKVVESMRLTPVAKRLSEKLGQDVVKCDDCIGDDVAAKIAGLENGQVALLENVRFYDGETSNDPEFAKQLAANADLYVNDAFGTAHRAHASTAGVTEYLSPSVAGSLIEKELKFLQETVDNPQRPLAAIVGGSKVSSKIGVIETLLDKVDKIFIGGGMIFTFYKARGINVGASLVEEDKLELATKLEAKAKEKGVEFLLPTDIVVADKFAADANTQTVSVDSIPDGWMGLDIGADSIKTFQAALADCKSVIWNGPMGVFEMEAFAKGTNGIATTLAGLTGTGCTTIIGGGDSVAAVEQAGLAEQMSHISTGGGASLELLEGKVLPGIAALDDA
ncbi:MAG: phosphoglycerate kinase [Cyanobacteria bacterium P01_D01_bin.105]